MVRACIPVLTAAGLLPGDMVNTFACDQWAAIHVINPFLLTVYSRSAFFGFFMAGIGELIEAVFLWCFSNYAIYVSANSQGETIAMSLVDDWLIQGGIGALMGWVFYRTVDAYPSFLNYTKPLHLFYYLFMVLGLQIILTSVLFMVAFGGFLFGINLTYVVQGLVILFIFWTEPRSVGRYHRLEFGAILWFHCISYVAQSQFDWFFSGAYQTWLITGILIVGFWAPYSLLKHDWFRRIRLNFTFEW